MLGIYLTIIADGPLWGVSTLFLAMFLPPLALQIHFVGQKLDKFWTIICPSADKCKIDRTNWQKLDKP